MKKAKGETKPAPHATPTGFSARSYFFVDDEVLLPVVPLVPLLPPLEPTPLEPPPLEPDVPPLLPPLMVLPALPMPLEPPRLLDPELEPDDPPPLPVPEGELFWPWPPLRFERQVLNSSENFL